MASALGLRAYGVAGAGLSRVFFGLVRRWQAPARETAFRQLLASQWWSADRLRAEQWGALQRLLSHAYENVPYYRDVFQSLGAEPGDFRNTGDVARLPLLQKEDIQAHGQRLKAIAGFDPKGVYVNHTGGSTGMPLTFWQDSSYRAWGMAELDRNFWMCGYRPGQRQAFLWGSDYDSKTHKSLTGKLHDLILNLRWVNTFDLDTGKLRATLAELVEFRPTLLVGYVSSLTLLAQLIETEGRAAPRPRAIQTSAEVLTPAARDLIERTLGGRCFDRYGCREVGNIAHECDAHTGLHLLIESNYTEFVSDEGLPVTSGKSGQIVVTNLRNYVMPFIRYATGDVGLPSNQRCNCGRGLPLLSKLDGRLSEVIVAPGGRLLHGEFFTHLFYGAGGIRQFQVEQVNLHELVIRIVAESDEAYDAACAKVEPLILRHGDPAFRLQFSRVAQIPPRKSGKYCFTLSHVPVSFRRSAPNAVA